MAHLREEMARTTPSESSTLSNIIVEGHWSSSSPEPSSLQDTNTTPPTSMTDTINATIAEQVQKSQSGTRKSTRARTGVTSYNLQKLSNASDDLETSPTKRPPARLGSSRNVSGLTGRTLVESDDGNSVLVDKTARSVDEDTEMPDSPPANKQVLSSKIGRKPSVKDKVRKAAGKLGSVLGKRSRDVMEKGKDTFWRKDEKAVKESDPKQHRVLKQLDTGSKGLLDEIDLDADMPQAQRPSKKLKTPSSSKTNVVKAVQLPAPSNPLQKTSNGNRVKKWQTAGLYVGQPTGSDTSTNRGRAKKLQKKRPTSSATDEDLGASDHKTHLNMTLPMFSYFDRERPFTIPFDIFAPSVKKGDERPKDWHQLNKNRLIGDAKDMWSKEDKLARSLCLCRSTWNGKDEGCGDDCLNRTMEYECNQDNCELPPWACANRQFSDLAERLKKGGPYDIGVEVVKTPNRGFGVRACRSFPPGQIIMEYTGEIITEDECQRRMREVYKDKSNFYLMEMERGTHIDGTKGSMARFINHCCAPNCQVRLVKVNGVPRMGVFAGEDGITTGEELTYDYNFDNFGDNKQQCFCGAATCRGHLGKKLSAAEQKKREREENERMRLAAEEARKAAEQHARRQTTQSGQDKAGWKGWVDLNDPETRMRIKAEQEARKSKDASSDRAMRLAARRGSVPPRAAKSSLKIEKVHKAGKSERRKTTAFETTKNSRMASDSSRRALLPSLDEDVQDEGTQDEGIQEVNERIARRRSTSTATRNSVKPYLGSKFKEDVSHSPSPESMSPPVTQHTTITVKKEVTMTTTSSDAGRAASPELGHDDIPLDTRRKNSFLDTEDPNRDVELPDSEEERIATASERPSKRSATAGKGELKKRSMLKAVGNALSRTVKGGASSHSLFGNGSSNGRMKQSKLSFQKLM